MDAEGDGTQIFVGDFCNVPSSPEDEGHLTLWESNCPRSEDDADMSDFIANNARKIPVDENGNTALHVAARNRDWDTFLDCLNHAPEEWLQFESKDGFAPLHYAVETSERSVHWKRALERLIEKGGYTDSAAVSNGDTPLHLAVKAENSHAAQILVDEKLKRGRMPIDLERNIEGKTPLDIAAEKGDGAAAFQILRLQPQSRFLNDLFQSVWKMHSASIVHNSKCELEFLLSIVLDEMCIFSPWLKGGLWKYVSLLWLVRRADFDVNDVYGSSEQTLLHIAIVEGYDDVAKIILENRNADLIDASREDSDGITPLQCAVEKGMQEIANLLMRRAEVRDHVERLYRDRQVYVDATSAILVAAALIASVTFAGWLQPPLGFGNPGEYAAVEGHVSVSSFWVFNSLSFFFAISTVVAGVGGVLPKPDVHIGTAVQSLRRALSLAAFLLMLSIAVVLGAFASAGFAVLPPTPRWETSMIVTTAIGGATIVLLTGWFLMNLYPLRPGYAKRRRQATLTIRNRAMARKKSLGVAKCRTAEAGGVRAGAGEAMGGGTQAALVFLGRGHADGDRDRRVF